MARKKKAPPKGQSKPTVKIGPGRPSLFDARRGKKITASIKRGLTYTRASMAAGVSYDSFRLWRNRGKADYDDKLDTELSRFYVSIKTAEMAGEDACAAVIEKARRRTWQAAAWWLERIVHKRWGRKDKLESENKNANLILPLMGNGAMLPTKKELIFQLQQLVASMPDEEPHTIESNGHISNGHKNGDDK